jgi:hypothetical protein
MTPYENGGYKPLKVPTCNRPYDTQWPRDMQPAVGDIGDAATEALTLHKLI